MISKQTELPNEIQWENKLVQIAAQLRALSTNGQFWAEDPYQLERYQKILGLSAQLMSLVDERPASEIERIYFDDMRYITPTTGVETAVFDEAGRILLIQRADDQTWAIPGGSCDMGEAPAAGGVREVWEETGYLVEITALIGLFDSRLCGTRTSSQIYHIVFAGRVIGGEATTSRETLDARWVAPDAIPWQNLNPGHEKRLRVALAWHAAPDKQPHFDTEPWTPPA